MKVSIFLSLNRLNARVRCLLLLQCLDIDDNLELASDRTASILDSKIMAIELRHRGVINDFFSLWGATAVHRVDVEYHFPAFLFDRQLAYNRDRVSISPRFYLRALKENVRVVNHIKKIRRTEVCIASLVAGLDTPPLDLGLNGRAA